MQEYPEHGGVLEKEAKGVSLGELMPGMESFKDEVRKREIIERKRKLIREEQARRREGRTIRYRRDGEDER